MRAKVRAGVALVLALLGTVTLAAAPAGAAPGGALPSRAGKVLIAQRGVLTFEKSISVGGATIQATPPESFCYVGVIWPAAILPDYRATATWSLDCRSLANPSLPAPDIGIVNMKVRIHQGEYSVWDPSPSLGGTECQSLRTNPSCSTTSQVPLAFGAPYHTQLDVTVSLTGGTVQQGGFYTAAIRLS